MYALVAQSLARRHGAYWALRDSSFNLPLGSATLVFGPNGAGKTTLLRLCASSLSPTRGTLHWFGQRTAPRERIALLSHTDGLFDDLTAAEHMELGARLLRTPLAHISRLLERVGLADRAHTPVRTYSAGMRRRLGFARLLQKPAELIVLDEPYTALDPAGATLVDTVIMELHKRGCTLLIATHQVEQTARICDRAIQIQGGRVSWNGSAVDAIPLASKGLG